MSERHLLILGAGSVGKRHIDNFGKMGCKFSAMDPRRDRLDEVSRLDSVIDCYLDLESSLEKPEKYDGVVVCSPPKFHVDQCIKSLERNLPVFLEKPVCADADSAKKLVDVVNNSTAPLLLGYTYRWWPPLREMKKWLEDKMVGNIHHVRCVMSAHLADWHPWENYQDFFMASKELGGGALLDESHFVDLMYWMFGKPRELYAKVEKLSDLDIETDDNVDALMFYDNNMRVSIHLDLFGRPHEKFIVVSGDNGTIQWSFDPNRIRYSNEMTQDWDEKLFEYERNDMFVEAAKEFMDILEQGTHPSCTIEDGYHVMQILEAMRESSVNDKQVKLV